jgi:hypothetical protein
VRSSHQFEEEIGVASSENGHFIAKMKFSVRTAREATSEMNEKSTDAISRKSIIAIVITTSRGDASETRAKTRGVISETRAKTRGVINETRAKTRGVISETRAKTRGVISETRAKTRDATGHC